MNNLGRIIRVYLLVLPMLTLVAATANAQTTAFNYQGRLTDGGNAANGNFQMQFKLFDALSAGSQIGTTLTDIPVAATNGTFSVRLDFGSAPLNGANRFLEIAVRRNSSESYVTLTPREQIVSSPYSVKSISADTATNATNAANSSQLGGLPPSRYVQSDASGNVGIGATPGAGSKLTVGGQLELTSGGIKFPNASTQTAAGLTSVATSGPLTGNGTSASPLGIQTPLPTREINAPSRQPFYSNGGSVVVPAGKLLVIEYVSGLMQNSSSNPLPWMNLTVDGSTRAFFPPDTWSENGTTRIWLFSKQVKIYISAGQTVFVGNSSGPTDIFKHIWGYYVDVP